MFNNIVCAVDGSGHANKAIDTAVDLAGKYGARLMIVCVYRHHSPLESSLAMVRPAEPETPDAALADYASTVAAAARERAVERGATEVEAFAKRGQPARAIVAFAEHHHADAIVVGARGLGDIGGFLLGSVSHKVVSLSPMTCITVK